MNTFDTQIEEAYGLLSGIYKEQTEDRDARLNKMLEGLAEDDPKREKLEITIKAIYDAYDLTRVKEFIPYTGRIKQIELEKPEQRVFNFFESKYTNSPYHMYKLKLALEILDRHNPREDNGNLLFLIAFARLCKNYTPEVPEQHAFMYYTVYNIIVMDLYSGKDYEDHAGKFLKNINGIADELVAKYNK